MEKSMKVFMHLFIHIFICFFISNSYAEAQDTNSVVLDEVTSEKIDSRVRSDEISNKIIQKDRFSNDLYVPGEVLIKFKKQDRKTVLDSIVKNQKFIKKKYNAKYQTKFEIKLKKEFKILNKIKNKAYVLVSSELPTQELIAHLKNDPDIELVSPNYIRSICDTYPNDPGFNLLWGLQNTGQSVNDETGTPGADIKAVNGWDETTDASSVVIAVIDTGIYYHHPDLEANMWVNPNEIPGNNIDDDENGYIDDIYGIDSYNNTSNPMDDHFHGTHVAGTIAAAGNNNIGMSGVCWSAKLMAVKSLGSWGSGNDASAIEAIEYVIDMKLNHGINIVAINASWGNSSFSQPLMDAIEAAGDAGIAFIAAAGNWGRDNDGESSFYPASYNLPNIISVAASDQNDKLASFSHFGANSVDLAAPGVNIISTLFDHTPDYTDIFYDDMESGSGKWNSTSNNSDHWTISNSPPLNNCVPENKILTPYHSWKNRPHLGYQANTYSSITVNEDIDLSGYIGKSVHIVFSYKIGMDDDLIDYFELQFSKDSGHSWIKTFKFYGNALNCWLESNLPIEDKYKSSNFRIRINLKTYNSNSNGGVYIDDIGIVLADPDYDFKKGTSMSAPHVAGAYALIADKFPSESMERKIQRIVEGVDKIDSLEGKVKSSGRLNIEKSIRFFEMVELPSIAQEFGQDNCSQQNGCQYGGDDNDVDGIDLAEFIQSL